MCVCVFVYLCFLSFCESKRADLRELGTVFTSIDGFLAVKHVDGFPDGDLKQTCKFNRTAADSALSFCNVPCILSFSFSLHRSLMAEFWSY